MHFTDTEFTEKKWMRSCDGKFRSLGELVVNEGYKEGWK